MISLSSTRATLSSPTHKNASSLVCNQCKGARAGARSTRAGASPAPTIHDGRGPFHRIVGASLAGALKTKDIFMPNPHRQEKLGELIAVELSDLLRTRTKDPRIGFASITHVEVSGDLRHAKIFVSVMGSEEEQNGTIKALKHATGFLRHELAGRLVLRYMPELVFKLDTSIVQGARILELIHKSEQEHSTVSEQP